MTRLVYLADIAPALAAIPIGRELDAVIAEKVMGYRWLRSDTPPAGYLGPSGDLLSPWRWLTCLESPRIVWARGDETRFLEGLPHFSTEIGPAWAVVEALARRGWKVDVQNRAAPTWGCHVNFAAPEYRHVFECEDTAPLAICRAALAALEVAA